MTLVTRNMDAHGIKIEGTGSLMSFLKLLTGVQRYFEKLGLLAFLNELSFMPPPSMGTPFMVISFTK